LKLIKHLFYGVRTAVVVTSTTILAACATFSTEDAAPKPRPELSSLKKLAEIDPRYQSYNIEMVQVTGGRFWAPYGGPKGETHRYLAPVDLANPRLRALAAQLSPAYVRVSGTWASSTYVPSDGEQLSEPPAGFGQLLTKVQWQGVVDFSKALNSPIVTSFAASNGTRDSQGRWSTEQANRLLSLTKSSGGDIYAAEFLNEPSLVMPGGLPRD
jgi:hypothetical protein